MDKGCSRGYSARIASYGAWPRHLTSSCSTIGRIAAAHSMAPGTVRRGLSAHQRKTDRAKPAARSAGSQVYLTYSADVLPTTGCGSGGLGALAGMSCRVPQVEKPAELSDPRGIDPARVEHALKGFTDMAFAA